MKVFGESWFVRENIQMQISHKFVRTRLVNETVHLNIWDCLIICIKINIFTSCTFPIPWHHNHNVHVDTSIAVPITFYNYIFICGLIFIQHLSEILSVPLKLSSFTLLPLSFILLHSQMSVTTHHQPWSEHFQKERVIEEERGPESLPACLSLLLL